MFLATALLGPDHASAWLIQATHSVVTASVVLAADNARNASGAPADTISSLTFPFPITTGGGVSEPERVIFWNRGSSSLSLTGISYTGPFSTGVTNCSGTLAANAYCYDWINYTPTAIGPQTGAATLNFTGGSQAIPLSGTGQSGSIVIVSGCGLPGTLAANTTYVMGDVTCSNHARFGTSNGSVLQGDCRQPEGAGTIFDGLNAQGYFMVGVFDNTSNVVVRCITVTRYGANGASCPDTSGGAGASVINLYNGWLLASSTIENSCGTGVATQGGSNEIYNTLIFHNAFTGGAIQNTSGTMTALGTEWAGNSFYVGANAGDCNFNYDCGSFKVVGGGAAYVFDGMYAHDQTNPGSTTNAGVVGAWCDGIGNLPENCATSWTVQNSTIKNNNGDGIRAEVMTNVGIFQHNVITNNNGSGSGQIVGACAVNITANNNYLANGTAKFFFNPVALGSGDWVGRCGGYGGSFSLTAKNNIVYMPNNWFQFGSTSSHGSISVSADFNQFYVGANGTGVAVFDDAVNTGAFAFATWQARGHDAHGSISTGSPPSPPSGCTGDGTYGIGCRGSGM
jgi:hypothetical protein